ncbi:hypothetical protein Tco_0997786 [Tanacetum coccineum]
MRMVIECRSGGYGLVDFVSENTFWGGCSGKADGDWDVGLYDKVLRDMRRFCAGIKRSMEDDASETVLQAELTGTETVGAGEISLSARGGSSLNSIPADYVSAGHVLVPADSDRIC